MAELVDATDSKSVELRFMSVRVGLGVPFTFFYDKNRLTKIFTFSPNAISIYLRHLLLSYDILTFLSEFQKFFRQTMSL